MALHWLLQSLWDLQDFLRMISSFFFLSLAPFFNSFHGIPLRDGQFNNHQTGMKMQVGCVQCVCVCCCCWLYGKIKRIWPPLANYSELFIIHTQTLVPSLHWHIHMWWKPSAEIDKGGVFSVCRLHLLCQPQCCVMSCWAMFAFINGSKCGVESAPVVPVCVCVCLLPWLPCMERSFI